MGVASHIAGRFVKFEIGTSGFSELTEFEIVSGSVSQSVEHQTYLPVGRKVMNVISHGHTVMYTFQGVLLVGATPWNDYDPGTLAIATNGLTPGETITNLYVTLNRGGTSTDDSYYDEIYHYSATAQVLSIEHAFDTGNHQVFNVQIIADGSYQTPNTYGFT